MTFLGSEFQNYSVFKKCVSISVLDFRLFNGEDYFYSRFILREAGRKAGEYDNKIQTAKNMIKKGFDKKDIIEITGLTAKELDNLPV